MDVGRVDALVCLVIGIPLDCMLIMTLPNRLLVTVLLGHLLDIVVLLGRVLVDAPPPPRAH